MLNYEHKKIELDHITTHLLKLEASLEKSEHLKLLPTLTANTYQNNMDCITSLLGNIVTLLGNIVTLLGNIVTSLTLVLCRHWVAHSPSRGLVELMLTYYRTFNICLENVKMGRMSAILCHNCALCLRNVFTAMCRKTTLGVYLLHISFTPIWRWVVDIQNRRWIGFVSIENIYYFPCNLCFSLMILVLY